MSIYYPKLRNMTRALSLSVFNALKELLYFLFIGLKEKI